MVLVPGGHVVSNNTNVSVLHLPRNMGTQSRHTTFEPLRKQFLAARLFALE